MPTKRIPYKDQLLDPRWQRKRLEILTRSDFSCEVCGAKDKTLHVHHKKYVTGRMAWEYTAPELVSLCKDCHASGHDAEEALKGLMASMTATEDVADPVASMTALIGGYVAPHGQPSSAAEKAAYKASPLLFRLGAFARYAEEYEVDNESAEEFWTACALYGTPAAVMALAVGALYCEGVGATVGPTACSSIDADGFWDGRLIAGINELHAMTVYGVKGFGDLLLSGDATGLAFQTAFIEFLKTHGLHKGDGCRFNPDAEDA